MILQKIQTLYTTISANRDKAVYTMAAGACTTAAESSDLRTRTASWLCHASSPTDAKERISARYVHKPKEYALGIPYIERSRNSIVLVQINQTGITPEIAKGGSVLQGPNLQFGFYLAKRQVLLTQNLKDHTQMLPVFT